MTQERLNSKYDGMEMQVGEVLAALDQEGTEGPFTHNNAKAARSAGVAIRQLLIEAEARFRNCEIWARMGKRDQNRIQELSGKLAEAGKLLESSREEAAKLAEANTKLQLVIEDLTDELAAAKKRGDLYRDGIRNLPINYGPSCDWCNKDIRNGNKHAASCVKQIARNDTDLASGVYPGSRADWINRAQAAEARVAEVERNLASATKRGDLFRDALKVYEANKNVAARGIGVVELPPQTPTEIAKLETDNIRLRQTVRNLWDIIKNNCSLKLD